MIRKSYTLKNHDNEDIHIDIQYREDARNAPTVIIVHGFKGFKDWGFFPDIARRLASSGYVTLTFNFSRNGIGLDPSQFTELDKFADNTYSHELNDLKCIIEAIKSGEIGSRIIDPERLGLIGHSRGGAIALLTAIEMSEDIQVLVTWSTVSNLFRFSDDQIREWEENGVLSIENKRTKQMMPINKIFWDDLNKNKTRFDLIKAAEKLEIPTLFIHGLEDTSVPAAESEELFENCQADVKRLELLEDTGHTFDIRHPIVTLTPAYETVCDLTEHWLDNYLNI